MMIAPLILAVALAAGTFGTFKAVDGGGNVDVSAVSSHPGTAPATTDWPWEPAGGVKQPYAAPVKSFEIPSRASQTRRSYDWPIKPFDRQHVVRAYLDDPRIPRDLSAHNFHIGIDIGCPAGTPVYAIEAGTARRSHGADASVVEVYSADRSLSYWHIRPAVRDWQHVQRHTLVGWTLWNFNHVHLSERDSAGYVNPLRLGGLGPFVDHTIPKTIRVSFRAGAARRNPLRLRGRFDIVADAVDLDPGVSPQPWAVTPSLLRWRILRGGRVVVPRLEDTLRQLAEEGADAFYTGDLGRLVAEHVLESGGILTRDDLAAYRAVVREPLSVRSGTRSTFEVRRRA